MHHEREAKVKNLFVWKFIYEQRKLITLVSILGASSGKDIIQL